MMRKAVAAILLLLFAGLSASAERKLTRAENDSVVQALATIWGKYLHDKALKSSSMDDNAEYMRGLTDALNTAHTGNSYYTGLQDGIVIDSRLTQIEQMGGFSIDRSQLAKAFERAAKGRGTGFTPETADRYMNYIITAATADNAVKERSEAFIDSISSKPGVRNEMTGLRWEVLEEGTGEKIPMDTKSVDIRYVGRLFDGTVFDDHSAERPAHFEVADLIPGFAEALYIIRKGGTYRFYLPPEIAYGEAGVNGVIPPNAALVFDITLLDYSKE